MIHPYELIDPEDLKDIDKAYEWNLIVLCYKLNVLRRYYGHPMIINSGYRSETQHMRIYDAINNKRADQGLRAFTVPWGSQHLIGAAADISDPQGKLKHFIEENEHLLEQLDLYCEAFEATPTWVHIQLFAPKSGKRFFKP